MAGLPSKRQQARNEKLLQDLVLVQGNSFCADCSARNPAWASWSLGIFLCMRCAAIHRKLGTHISKVKSLSMDSWSNEQVENMKKVGNAASNKVYNPQNKKPAIPLDADEADSAMERFIRQKYMGSTATTSRHRRQNSVDTESDEGPPPPLPPKTSSKFGFRSASSIFPLGSRAKKQAAMRDALSSPRESSRSSPHLPNKPSKIFGASVEYDNDDLDRKLGQLRDMGFSDNQRNLTALKGVDGNLERAVESLVRLGDRDRRSPAPIVSARDSSLRATRSLTPITPTSANGPSGSRDGPTTPSTVSSNPFDMLPAQPQSSQSTGTLQNKNPYYSTNPFGLPPPQSDALSQAFQHMTLVPSQPLFPHHTGGIPSQTTLQPVYYESLAPAVVGTPQSYPLAFNNNLAYPQPAQPPQHVQLDVSHNPFLAAPAQHQIPQQTLAVNTASIPPAYGNNPFTRSPTRIQSPTLGQIPEQSQTTFYGVQPGQQPYQPQLQGSNPFFNQISTTQFPQLPQMAISATQQPYQPQRPDKASILALYNYPQLAPQPLAFQDQNLTPSSPESQHPPVQPPPRTSSNPLPGNKNPFLANMKSSASPVTGADVFAARNGHGSRDSVSLGMDMAWTNGRHSPDAFASLSARQ